ncbi:MAG: universal stress protein [Alphaproteobacteria bacterium]|nr:universal stress protein [Alphaproteobacteria bacterium]
MPLKNLLVHLDLRKAAGKRADAAIALAAAHDAHLTALLTAMTPSFPGYVAIAIPDEVRAQTEAEIRRSLALIEQSFRNKAEAAGIKYEAHTEVGVASPLGSLVLNSRYFDLTILGQADPSEPVLGENSLAEDAVLSCGRGVLVVPYVGASKGFGQRVMVAWDASREAARAVADAMPLLERAEAVTIATVSAGESRHGHGRLPATDIATHLARHGIAVDVKNFIDIEIGVANTLLSRIADQGVDLLVMGAYGHSRLREVILGGVTQNILKTMTVPVLMSH